MPRRSDRARYGHDARRVAQRDLRFNNISTYALAFLASFVSFFSFSLSLSLILCISRSISRFLALSPHLSLFLSLHLMKTTTVAARCREDVERKFARRVRCSKTLYIYYRMIINVCMYGHSEWNYVTLRVTR